MDTINVSTSHATHVPDGMQQEAAQQVSHAPNLGSTGLAISVRLHNHFEPHLETDPDSGQPAAPTSSARNAELNAIRNDRAQRLEAQGNTVHDMEKAEKNASRADRLFASIKSGMGGTPFAALTEAGNFQPSILQVAGVHANTVREAAIENAMACLYAGMADAAGNKAIAGFKPGYYLKPDSNTLHPALQASVAEKLLALDKGPLRNAFDEANKWLTGFAVRNTAMYASTLAMTAAGKENLDAILQPALRPVTAIIVGMAIEHYNVSRDRTNHLADPAMLYGRRDAVAEGQAHKPIDQDTEWLDDFNTLKDLDATALVKMVSARLGEGAATALNAVISGDALKEIADPVSVVGNGLLIGGFSAMGAGTTATANLAQSKALGKMATTAVREAVKNVLGTLAFGLWAAGASLGGSLPKKATAAVDAHVPKVVEGSADAVGRVAVKGGEIALKTSLTSARFAKETAVSGANHTKHAVQAAGGGVVSVASAIGDASQSAWTKGVGALRQRGGRTAQGSAVQGQNMPLQPLAATQTQASSSAPARPLAQDDGDVV
ncbi:MULTISPECIES: RopAA-2 [Pseudomonas]|uniref:RopAA-2 n=1 Tax=Pseudomonas TaxID=286 RepID=UPI001BEB9080|nr:MULTISPECIES: RopAA-2 [Pseudomonas]MBT2339839.1 RopAA-2 [Pseudomonas fluorescens]MCD4530355.1 RopAA-2 [Pseudomonas sp. C3-2018]